MTAKNISDKVKLNNDVLMPWLGLGVFQAADGNEVENAVKYALEAGYKSIDTASIYRNEKGVGSIIERTLIPRNELFITSKLWNSDQGYESTLKAFEDSLKKLKIDYLDLFLIHWPVENKFVETWKAFEKLFDEKLIRAIGVSNFTIYHLEELFKSANIIPAVNQIEFHPFLTQIELVDFCKKHNIQVEAWSPIMKGTAGTVPEIVTISKKYSKTPAQIVLRYDLQKEIVTIPKSVNKNRIIENSQIFDFNLTSDEIETIDSLNKDYRFGADPNNFDF